MQLLAKKNHANFYNTYLLCFRKFNYFDAILLISKANATNPCIFCVLKGLKSKLKNFLNYISKFFNSFFYKMENKICFITVFVRDLDASFHLVRAFDVWISISRVDWLLLLFCCCCCFCCWLAPKPKLSLHFLEKRRSLFVYLLHFFKLYLFDSYTQYYKKDYLPPCFP